MSYIDGFVIAVPTANKQKFIEHARHFDALFIELGAIRVIEAWGDDVPDGMKKMMEDPRMDPSTPGNPPMPFDGKRMIYGGFQPVVEVKA
jgi:uncharacterized protein YbaA (DUF1428 family)